MATYIPGVKDYIPKLKPFTPNYKFLQDVLEVRQDRYTSNFKQLNSLYNQVVNADLSIEANRKTRDSYAKNLSEKLKQVSGKDLSLQGNVEQAKALFRPFYEDDKILYDMGYTASVKKQMKEAEKLKYSNDEKQREMYWNQGMQRLQWHLEDFSKMTPDQAMSVPIPKYVPNVNMIDLGIEKLKEWTGNKDISSWEMTDQGLEITTTNGTAITADVVGYERDSQGRLIKENGKLKPITVNRAADYLNQTLLQDPRVQDYYATSAYVEGRNWWSNPENIKTYGNEEKAKQWWLQDIVRQSVDNQIQQIVKLDSEMKGLETTSQNWQAYMEKTGIVPGTGEYQYYTGILDQLQLLEETKRSMSKNVRDLKSPVESMKQLEGLAYKAIAVDNIARDISNASSLYATIGKKTDVKFNEREKLLMQHRHKLAQQAHKARLDEILAMKKGEIGGGEPWNPFADPQVSQYNYPGIDWDNIEEEKKDRKKFDNIYWDKIQNDGIADLAKKTTDAKIKTILDAYNNKDTGFSQNNNLTGQPGQITYSRQNPLVTNVQDIYGNMDGVMAETVISAANDLEKEQVSTDLATFKQYMSMPENSDELDRLYQNVFESSNQFQVQPVDFNGRQINAYVWQNANGADNPAFSRQMVENQLEVEGLTSITNAATEELNKTKFNIANVIPDKRTALKGKLPLAMYDHELELLNSGQRVTWDQVLAKRLKDSKEGKNFKDANIITFDEQSYIDNWVNYYKSIAPSKEDRDKMDPKTLKKNYPYWGVISPKIDLGSPKGYEFRAPTKYGEGSKGQIVFNEEKARKDAKEVYEDLRFFQNRLAMDPDANWGGGLPTFDVRSFTAGLPQLGTGATAGYVYNFDYDAWDLKKGKQSAKMAVPHIASLLNVTSIPNNYIARIGDQSYSFDEDEMTDEEEDLGTFISDPEAENVLAAWKQSLAYDPKTNSDAARAQFQLKYIPDGAGGQDAENKYAAYELSFTNKVANNLISKAVTPADGSSASPKGGAVNQDSDFWEKNSIMIFVEKDLDNNPLKSSNQGQDYINSIMNHYGHFTASIPNGGTVTYRNSPDGTMIDMQTYRFDEESGNVVLSNNYTEMAGVSNKQLQDNLFDRLEILTGIANTTIQSKNQYKKSMGGAVQN